MKFHITNIFFLAKIKRLRAFGYFSLLQPLKEKYPSQNLEELAKFGKCNIKIWFQPKRAKDPELISKSATTYLHDLNFVTKNRYHPYSYGRLQLDMDDLKSTIYKSQSSKIVKMKIWEAIEQNFKISKTEFIQQWGKSISIEKELEFRETFGKGFSVYVNHNANFYTAEKLYASMFPGFSFIVNPCDGEEFDIELEVTVILSNSYLRPYFCEATENCSYTVKKFCIYETFQLKFFLISHICNIKTRDRAKMDRHEKTCTSKTRMKYKETMYGTQDSIRRSLENEGILSPDYEIPFVTYDIETISKEENLNGQMIKIQKPITIAYWDGEFGEVFWGENMVKQFLAKMNEIQVKIFQLYEIILNTFSRKKIMIVYQ